MPLPETQNNHQSEYLEKEAYLLFGGVSSGKSSFCGALNQQRDMTLLSADELIYERSFAMRNGRPYTAFSYRKKEIIEGNTNQLLVCDFMPPKQGPIVDIIKHTHSTITAVFINISEDERYERFLERQNIQNKVLEKMSKILGVTLIGGSNSLNKVLSNPQIYKKIQSTLKREYEILTKVLYLSGAQTFSESVPTPRDFSYLDYVIEFGNETEFIPELMFTLEEQKIPFADYKKDNL